MVDFCYQFSVQTSYVPDSLQGATGVLLDALFAALIAISTAFGVNLLEREVSIGTRGEARVSMSTSGYWTWKISLQKDEVSSYILVQKKIERRKQLLCR